jgi:hypothetical protein
MRKSVKSMATMAFAVSSALAPAYAQQQKVQDVIVVGPDTQLGADAGKQVAVAQSTNLRGDWMAFLSEKGIHEGQNEPQTPGQAPFQIFSEQVEIHSKPTDPHWLDERAIASDQAVLGAKAKFATFLDSQVQAGRTSSLFQNKGQGIPAAGDKVAKALSIVDKMRTLTGKALDEQIKNIDPTWDGTGKTTAEQEQRVVMVRRQYEEQVKASAQAFATGATPIYTAEGPTRNGYGVLVGLVISGNMQKIARAFSDPSIQLPVDAPEAPVAKQIADRYGKDPKFLSVTEGVRIMTDDHGARVLVCFAGVADAGDSMTTEKEAELSCRGRIAQFVGEQIAVDDGRSGGLAYDKLAPQQNGSGPNDRVAFDQKMKSTTTALTQQISMAGLMQIGYYETEHYYTKQPMVVAVYEWSQASGATAQRLRHENEPRGNSAAANSEGVGAASTGIPAAASVGRGLSTNPSKF